MSKHSRMAYYTTHIGSCDIIDLKRRKDPGLIRKQTDYLYRRNLESVTGWKRVSVACTSWIGPRNIERNKKENILYMSVKQAWNSSLSFRRPFVSNIISTVYGTVGNAGLELGSSSWSHASVSPFSLRRAKSSKTMSSSCSVLQVVTSLQDQRHIDYYPWMHC